jgi:hypothetical protein
LRSNTLSCWIRSERAELPAPELTNLPTGRVGPSLLLSPFAPLVAAVVAGTLSWVVFLLPPPPSVADFDQFHIAARALARGADPYAAVRDAGWTYGLLYPLPAVLLALPLAWLPLEVARSLWVAAGAGLLAFAAQRYGRGLGVALLSAPFTTAIAMGQWAPFLTAAAVLPWLGLFLAAKPTIGGAIFLGYPDRRALWSGLAIVAVSLVLRPDWPVRWVESLPANITNVPLLLPGGLLLLLGLLRWRTAEGRLVAALACVPQTIGYYDMLPLFLIPRRRTHAYVLAALTYAAWYLTALRVPDVEQEPLQSVLVRRWPYLLVLVYLPALAMALGMPPFRTSAPVPTRL